MFTDLFQMIRINASSTVAALQSATDINVRQDDGQNLLHMAIAYGNQPVICELFKLGIDVNAQDSRGQTPLHYAATRQNVDAAELILSNGGDMSVRDSHGNSALWSAVFSARGNYGVVKALLSHGGGHLSVVKNKHGKSPIEFAVQISDCELTELLKLYDLDSGSMDP
jgi:uncharacterized protein